jgi:hypothetical protein
MANTAEQDHLNQTIVTTLENDNHNTVEENKVGNEIDEGDDKCVEVEVEMKVSTTPRKTEITPST